MFCVYIYILLSKLNHLAKVIIASYFASIFKVKNLNVKGLQKQIWVDVLKHFYYHLCEFQIQIIVSKRVISVVILIGLVISHFEKIMSAVILKRAWCLSFQMDYIWCFPKRVTDSSFQMGPI